MTTEVQTRPLDPNYSVCKTCEASFYVGSRGQQINCNDCQKAKTEMVTSKLKSEALQFVETQVVHIIKNKKKVFFFRWLLVWFLIGSGFAFWNRHEDLHGCVYRSIGSLINPGYLIGCEIFRERWEIGK